jgi:hypothetical protein
MTEQQKAQATADDSDEEAEPPSPVKIDKRKKKKSDSESDTDFQAESDEESEPEAGTIEVDVQQELAPGQHQVKGPAATPKPPHGGDVLRLPKAAVPPVPIQRSPVKPPERSSGKPPISSTITVIKRTKTTPKKDAQKPPTFISLVSPSLSPKLTPTVKPFARIQLPVRSPFGPPIHFNTQFCPACHKSHPRGACELKVAGVEHCGLCGLAHFGYSRTCPHIKSETQVREMLQALKNSPEKKELIDLAMKYLRGVKGTLVQQKKKDQEKAAAAASMAATNRAVGMAMGGGGGGGGSGPVSGMWVPQQPQPQQLQGGQGRGQAPGQGQGQTSFPQAPTAARPAPNPEQHFNEAEVQNALVSFLGRGS